MLSKYALPFFILFLLLTFPDQASHAQITGRVSDLNHQALPQVNIVIKGTNEGTQTNAYGEYTITANPGEILLFSHIGRQSMERRVERSPSVINIRMPSAVIELEGVEKETWRRHKTQKELLVEYPDNKHLVKSAWGILDKDHSSTAIRIIDGEDLIPVGQDFLYSLQGHTSHMRVVRDDPEDPGVVKVYLRQFTGSPSTVLFDVDGMLLVSTPTYLNAIDIDRIAILEGNAAFMRYGPQGTGGVIIINTRSQTWMDDTGIIRTYDNRSLMDSLSRKASHPEPYRPHTPSYMDDMLEATTEKQALSLFEEQKERYRKDPYYFLDAYDFFLSRWGNIEESNKLIRPIFDDFSKDVAVLKALAYLQQKYALHEDALDVYLEILKLSYDQAQSHRDAANAYAEAGDLKRAMEFYANYIQVSGQLSGKPFDANGNDQMIATEMVNLMTRNTEVFPAYNELLNDMEPSETPTRLVFEWNLREAEFELQFVTPDGYYDTWSNKAGIAGYGSKQFFIDRENKGQWQVIIDYTGKRSKVPTYLKVSVYQDYGLKSQHLDIKTYKLSEKNVQELLFTFLN